MGDESKSGVDSWQIPKESELRIEVAPKHSATLKLVKGSAEVFGAELLEGKEYTFSEGAKIPVYSWYGATVSVTDARALGDSAYISSDTPMNVFANIHQILEARRAEAVKTGTHGPRVLVVGPTDAGKSSLTRILLSYAVRAGRTPIYVDLDVGQGDLSVPGTICATALTKTSLDPQVGFVLTTPLVYSLGAVTPSHNLSLYKHLVAEMSSVINKRMADPAVRASGMVINTCGWVTGDGYDLIVHAAQTMAVDVVLVLGQDRLHAQLSRDLPKVTLPAIPSASKAEGAGAGVGAGGGDGAEGSNTGTTNSVDLLKLPATGGAVPRSTDVRRLARQQRVRAYFYGLDNSLSPSLTTLSFDDVELFRIGGDILDDDMVRPIGSESVLDPVRVVPISPEPKLEHFVAAVSCATSAEQVNRANTAGFIVIQVVDMEARTLACLTPCPGPLPSKYLVVGTITFSE